MKKYKGDEGKKGDLGTRGRREITNDKGQMTNDTQRPSKKFKRIILYTS
jgi:hypothetical protein